MASSQLIFLISTMIFGLIISYIIEWPLVFGFSIGLLFFMYIVYRKGFGFKWMLSTMWEGIVQTKEVLWILVLIGMLIPIWTASGVIPFMIEKGVSFLHPSFFLLSCFVFAGLLSLLLGTAAGTLSIIGIPLLGIGALMNIPMSMIAGALVSGAFVGDRTSPFSSARLLVAASTTTHVSKHSKAMLPTTLMGLLFCVLIYGLMDMTMNRGSISWEQYDMFSNLFSFHFILLAPPIVLIVGILFRLRIKYCFLFSIALSVLLGTWLHNMKINEFSQYIWNGYYSAEIPDLTSTSLSDMISVMALIIAAGAFNGLMEKSQLMHTYIQKVLGETHSLMQATVRVVIFGFLLVLIACNQTLPMMMSGRNILPIWQKRFAKEELARIISDSSLLMAPMIPWNLLALLCSAIMGVGVLNYVPFAIFLWLMPIITIIYSALKTRFIPKRQKD